MSYFKRVLFIVITILTITTISAQEDRDSLVALPFVAYIPDTSLMIGATAVYVVRPEDRTEADIPDTYQVVGFYTLKKQIQFAFIASNFLSHGFVNNVFTTSFSKFNSVYYIDGMSDDEGEDYIPISYSFEDKFRLRLLRHVYAGPMFHYKSYRVDEYEENGYVDNSSIYGIKKSRVSAPGINVVFDNRDDTFYPTRGIFSEIIYLQNSEVVGATENSQCLEVNAATFYNLYSKRYILGFHGRSVIQGGDVPYDMYAGIGGDKILRGYLNDRYRGRNMYALQTELRFPFVFWDNTRFLKRLSAVVFGGAGSVSNDVTKLLSTKLHYAAGAGLRFALNDKEKINLRLDFTRNREGNSEVYFQIMEAF
ncbi:MAG: BamA/TamA family outer membrane protein [Spirochaetes bacterium]|nr:BamA/TamA family outer membrane protein [Spirochaetota bacterium]MBN2770097.1 BamA/TamA family outer membrane protein [Spirochaetota bacterium]